MSGNSIRPPAPRPCDSCPYRRDVPSGVWAPEEYEKLRRYDLPTMDQPLGVFLCHQYSADAVDPPVCAGWAGCHDRDELLALRFAALLGMPAQTVEAIRDYRSPVPLFESGCAAADHGERDIDCPGGAPAAAMVKITRKRNR